MLTLILTCCVSWLTIVPTVILSVTVRRWDGHRGRCDPNTIHWKYMHKVDFIVCNVGLYVLKSVSLSEHRLTQYPWYSAVDSDPGLSLVNYGKQPHLVGKVVLSHILSV